MISENDVFEAIRRGYSALQLASPSEIHEYFTSVSPEAMGGHISNVKGIVFEQEIVKSLNEHGLEATLFEQTNHPLTDISVLQDGDLLGEFQLKATDSLEYIRNTLEENPDIPIIATSEVAGYFENNPMIINSGLDNESLTDAVTDILTNTGSAISDSTIVDFVDSADAVTEGVKEFVGESLIEESILPFPISPVGLGIWAVKAFCGWFW